MQLISWEAMIIALIAALPGMWGLWQGRKKATVDAAQQAFELAQAAMKECKDLRGQLAKLQKELDAAYTRIDELKRRERSHLTKIARLEAKVEILEKQVIAMGGTPITGLGTEPGEETEDA